MSPDILNSDQHLDRCTSKPIAEITEALQASLHAMMDEGKHRYDPVRFHCIQTLCNKAMQASAAVAEILCMKAVKVRDQYEADIERSLAGVSEWVNRATRLSPESKPMLDSLLARYEIPLAQRMAKRVVQRHEAKDKPSLAALFVDSEGDLDHEKPSSFEAQLLHQERAVKHQFSGDAGDDGPEGVAQGYQFSDLKSYHLFKESSVKLHADHLVAQAIDGVPDNAGPLNAHRLAVNSLEMMKDISPAYLRRFVSYMDTLLWLEKKTKAETSTKQGVKRGKFKPS